MIVAFRPEQSAQLDRPVDEGIAYMVVTIRDVLYEMPRNEVDARVLRF